jgi:RNA polymerase-binding transcription factor
MPAAGKGGGRAAKSSSTTKSSKKAPSARATKAPAKTAKKATSARATKAPAKTAKKVTKKATKAPAKTPAKKAAKTTIKGAPAKTATKAAASATKTAEKAQPVKKGGKKTVICELSGFEVTPGTPNLSPKTLDRLKSRLLEERDRLRAQADDFAAEAEQLAREREGGDTQFDEESGEGDTVNVERERDLLLSASARQEVEDIELALNRMKRGTYGVCRYAGRRLPVERLEVRPWADVCVDCKARADRRR